MLWHNVFAQPARLQRTATHNCAQRTPTCTTELLTTQPHTRAHEHRRAGFSHLASIPSLIHTVANATVPTTHPTIPSCLLLLEHRPKSSQSGFLHSLVHARIICRRPKLLYCGVLYIQDILSCGSLQNRLRFVVAARKGNDLES